MSAKQRDGTGNVTTTSQVSIIAAPGAGYRLHINTVVVALRDALVTTTGTILNINDGTTAKIKVSVPATAGFATVPIEFGAEGLRLSENTALQANVGVNLTSGSIDVSAEGYVVND